MTDMNWKAAMNSEIFRGFVNNELIKAAQAKPVEPTEDEQIEMLEKFKEFEKMVRSSPKKLAVFRTLQEKFASDPEYTAKVKGSFVDAVMMLDLS